MTVLGHFVSVNTISVMLCLTSIVVLLLVLFPMLMDKRTFTKIGISFLICICSQILMDVSDIMSWMTVGTEYERLDVILFLMSWLFLGLSFESMAAYVILSIMDRKFLKSVHVKLYFCGMTAIMAAGFVIGAADLFAEHEAIHRVLWWLDGVYVALIALLHIGVITSLMKKRKTIGTSDAVLISLMFILPLVWAIAGDEHMAVCDLLMAVNVYLIFVISYMGKQHRMTEQEAALTDMQNELMLSQIKPHFVFNALSVIAGLCPKDSEAERAVVEFADCLRCSSEALLQKGPQPFERELFHIKTFEKIEKRQYPDSFEVVYDIGTRDFSVPSLTVQPIVENALKYGLKNPDKFLLVELITRETDDAYVIKVKDNGPGFDANAAPDDNRKHLGLKNAKSRLKSVSNAELTVESKAGEGTTVTITVPKRRDR